MNIRIALIALVMLLPMMVGCGRLVFKPKDSPQLVTLTPQQQQALAQQTQTLQQRATDLDRDNQELETMLAQSRQHINIMEDQVIATRERLQSTNGQLATLTANHGRLQKRTKALTASMRQNVSAEIRSNNTLLSNLTVQNIPGVEVRQDGDLIRIAIAGDHLFYYGGNQLKDGAPEMLRAIAIDLMKNYPQQIIGIEGHTDNTPVQTPNMPSNQHLSISWAMTVFDSLNISLRPPSGQFFTTGHGANHPLVSNATEVGKSRNRRIEMVVYPEKIR